MHGRKGILLDRAADTRLLHMQLAEAGEKLTEMLEKLSKEEQLRKQLEENLKPFVQTYRVIIKSCQLMVDIHVSA